MAHIFHIATAADWREALNTGSYTTSTIGRSLEDEGFIHASRRDQVEGVFERYYTGVREPLVLLRIDPSLLEAPVREESVGEDTYPHIYGPITRKSVVEVVTLNRRGHREHFARVFLIEVGKRMVIAMIAMALIVVIVTALRR